MLVVSLSLARCAFAQDHAPPDTPASDLQTIASAPDAASASSVPQTHAISDMLTQKFGVARVKAMQISQAVMTSASKYSLPPAIVLAIISIESRFKERAKGLHGATGLMQVVPAAHRQLVKNLDLKAPKDNIKAGAAILYGYVQSAQGDIAEALKRYGGSENYAQMVSERAQAFQFDAPGSATNAPH